MLITLILFYGDIGDIMYRLTISCVVLSLCIWMPAFGAVQPHDVEHNTQEEIKKSQIIDKFMQQFEQLKEIKQIGISELEKAYYREILSQSLLNFVYRPALLEKISALCNKKLANKWLSRHLPGTQRKVRTEVTNNAYHALNFDIQRAYHTKRYTDYHLEQLEKACNETAQKISELEHAFPHAREKARIWEKHFIELYCQAST